jgi:hypothetical protein
LEDALAALETNTARVLQEVQRSGVLPVDGTDEDATVRAFAIFQSKRTVAAATQINQFTDKLTKQVHSHDTRLSGVDFERVRFGFDYPVMLALSSVPQMLAATDDLQMHLAVSPTGGFITSDTPVFKYNQYCEGIECQGITGVASRGFQLFLPLSPQQCLIMYDQGVYNVPRADRRIRVSVALPADLEQINAMQLVSADGNVYFADWNRRGELAALAAAVRHHRSKDRTVVQEYGHDLDPTRSIVHSFETTPNLALALSFLKVRWRARSVALVDRIRRFRPGTPPPPQFPDPPEHYEDAYRKAATFSRFINRR